MKVLPFEIPKPGKEALVYQEDHELKFTTNFTSTRDPNGSYIAKGSGNLILGDTINDYREGDILVIGEHVLTYLEVGW